MSTIPPGPETGVSLYCFSSSNTLICCIVSEHSSHQWYVLDLDSWGNPDVCIAQKNSWGVDEDVQTTSFSMEQREILSVSVEAWHILVITTICFRMENHATINLWWQRGQRLFATCLLHQMLRLDWPQAKPIELQLSVHFSIIFATFLSMYRH
jgi:hypothetical protein